MSFESKVLSLISPVMTEGRAEFFNGTLFIEDVTTEIGRAVFHKLTEEFGVNGFRFNIYNPVNGFVADFI